MHDTTVVECGLSHHHRLPFEPLLDEFESARFARVNEPKTMGVYGVENGDWWVRFAKKSSPFSLGTGMFGRVSAGSGSTAAGELTERPVQLTVEHVFVTNELEHLLGGGE